MKTLGVAGSIFQYSLHRHSMYAIYAYIGVGLGVNVGTNGIHGVPGLV